MANASPGASLYQNLVHIVDVCMGWREAAGYSLALMLQKQQSQNEAEEILKMLQWLW